MFRALSVQSARGAAKVQVALPGVSGHDTFRWTWGRIGAHTLSVMPLLPGGTC